MANCAVTVLCLSLFSLVTLLPMVQGQEICTRKIDVCFIVDQSGSIVENGQRQNWDLVKNFIKNIINNFDIGYESTRVALVTFANQGIVRWNLDTYVTRSSLRNAVDRLGPGNGNTNTYLGLSKMIDDVFGRNDPRPRVPNIAIIITDGKSTINSRLTVPEAERAHRANIRIFAVGITSSIDEEELRGISSPPQEQNRNYWLTPNFDGLSSLVRTLQTETCRDPFAIGCDLADVTFIIDSSSSVAGNSQSRNWGVLRDALKQIVDRFEVALDRVRVGMINFASQPKIEFSLDSYDTADGVKLKIDQLSPLSTATNTAEALRLLRTMYTSRNGDRQLVGNVAILFTDGGSGDSDATFREAQIAKEEGIRILVVAVTNNIENIQELDELSNIASNRVRDLFKVNTYDDIGTSIDNIVNTACTEQVQFNECDVADMTLILDSSTSIVYQTFQNWISGILGFAGDFVDFFGVSKNGTHIGIVVFADRAEVKIDLDDYDNSAALREEIRELRHVGGETNIADAFRKTRSLYRATAATSVRGDRFNVKNIAILVTDGQANLEVAQLYDEAELLKSNNGAPEGAGVELFTVGVTNLVDEAQLREIASEPVNEHVFLLGQFSDLKNRLSEILDNACKTTTPPPTTSTTTTPTTTTTTTTTTTAPTTTTTTPTTTTTTPTTTTTTPTTTTTTPTTTTTTPTTTTTTPTTTTTTPTTTTPVSGSTTTTISQQVICNGQGADIVFVMDASGSINEVNFRRILDFVAEIISRVDVENGKIRIGAITFSDTANHVFDLNTYTNRGDMVVAIKKVFYSRQTTNTADALSHLRSRMFTFAAGDRPNYQNIAIIITDGESNNKNMTLREATLAKTSGIRIMTVGIGSWLDKNELENMASYPYQENMYHVASFAALDNLTSTLRDYICSNNPVCPNNPCRNGGSCVQISNSYECINCRYPYTGQNCTDECRNAADVVVALDASGSIGKENFRRALNFLSSTIDGMSIERASGSSGTRIGFLTFSSDARQQFDLDQYNEKKQILDAMSVRYIGGSTNTAAAIRTIREVMFTSSAGDRFGVPNYIILLTDGQADNSEDAWRESIKAREAGIQIIAIGIGQGINQWELESIASQPSEENVLIRPNFDTLDNELRRSIYQSICANERVCDTRNPCRNGGFCTNVMNGYTCRCRDGFSGVNCERRCSGKLDLTFVLDSSGSIRIERYPEVKEFLVNITKTLNVNQDAVRVGMVYWSDDANVRFRLNDYNAQQDVVNAIRATPFVGGRTYTAKALEVLIQEIYQSRYGDRSDAKNLVILVSDGNSNIEPRRTYPMAAAAREQGIHIIAVAVGKTFANMAEMNGIASDPDIENVFNVKEYSDLQNATVVDFISKGTCDDINECLSNPCRNGGICRDDLKRYFCECPGGFAGYNCERRCAGQRDVVFVLDISGSVEEDYQVTIEFTKQVIYGLDMSFDRTRIGALTYDTQYNNNGEFYLNRYLGNKQAVINALNFYHNGGRTNTQAALNVMRTQHFTSVNGDRPGVPNVAILVTDGYSNQQETNTVPEAQEAKRNGIQIFSIALGEAPNLRELNDIASDPDSEYVVRLRNRAAIGAAVQSVLEQLCQ